MIPFSYILLTAALVASPGAATAVVVRNTLAGGHRRGVAAAIGVGVANSVLALLAVLGTGALLASSPRTLLGLRLAGAAVLAALGVQAMVRGIRLLRAGAPVSPLDDSPLDGAARAGEGRAAAVQGLLTGLFNPAVMLFYVVIVPSFAGPPPGVTARLTALAACHVALALVCHCAWAWSVGAMRRALGSPAARHGLEVLTGALLLAMAVKVALAT